MGKRKRDVPAIEAVNGTEPSPKSPATQSTSALQIIIGTYEKVLHGISASWTQAVEPDQPRKVAFVDRFLFRAHESAVRCLAVSPMAGDTQKRYLASGGSDQVVNVYSLSTVSSGRNAELGSLQHHAGGVNSLCFPTANKLMTASDDNTIAIARTRDWTILSSIKAPAPKTPGQPSGDSASIGAGTKGVNDFDVHPSLKLMISVGKSERCMRLWNLVTGKKAAVLNFDRSLLSKVGESKFTTGEARRVRWNRTGDEFIIVFDRGCITYDLDSNAKCCILPLSRTKIHQVRYFSPIQDENSENLILLSTDDGQILFFSTQYPVDMNKDPTDVLPSIAPIAQLGEPKGTPSNRIKDFEILDADEEGKAFIVTGSSDGAVCVWSLGIKDVTDLVQPAPKDLDDGVKTVSSHVADKTIQPRQVGTLLGTYETGNRITCLKAFPLS